jgi:hypothetical protein
MLKLAIDVAERAIASDLIGVIRAGASAATA